METFPLDLNRQSCIDKMSVYQQDLIKDTRKSLVENITRFTEECNPIMTLNFPDRLWHKHKVTLIKELLERFGKLKIKSDGLYNTTITINNTNDLPSNIVQIIIEFPIDVC